MSKEFFYHIPLSAEKVIRGERLQKTGALDSIRQNIRLLLSTPSMRVRHAPSYQCQIQARQFLLENRVMEDDKKKEEGFKVQLEKNILQLIEDFEVRIHVEELNLEIEYSQESNTQLGLMNRRKNLDNCIQVIVKLKAKIKEEYDFQGEVTDLEDTIPLM